MIEFCKCVLAALILIVATMIIFCMALVALPVMPFRGIWNHAAPQE